MNASEAETEQVDCWHVLVCGLPLTEDSFDLGSNLRIQRIKNSLTVFDLAAAGAVGFRAWAALEPIAHTATSEILSPTLGATSPGYDALNKCWLLSALLMLRGFACHICPAASAYSWNFIAGHQKSQRETFRKQIADEGIDNAVYRPRGELPRFIGNLLDYHLRLLLPKQIRTAAFDRAEADWVIDHFESFNQLAADNERFRFGLEAVVDWRYSRDPRSAIARIWSGIESILGISAELVYRVSLYSASVIAPKGKERIDAFKRIKQLYGVRSKAVHGEPLSNEKLFEGLLESFDVLRALLLDAVERMSLRTEEDFHLELLS